MRILLAIIFPPLSVLLCGKWFQGLIISPLLTACFWVPGIIHALVVVNNFQRAQREHELLMAAAKSTIAANTRRPAAVR